MVFYDEVFPVSVSQKARGGPERRTEIVTLNSGHEERNAVWQNSKRRFNAGVGACSIEDIEAVLAFFENCNGRLFAFRWLDPFDFKSCSVLENPTASDQLIGTGDGTKTNFQLSKTYEQGNRKYSRDITKPIAQSVLISVNGIIKEQGADYSVNDLTGEITFQAAPENDAVIRAGFSFHIPARFDTDYLSLSYADIKAGIIPDMPIVEVLV